MSLNLFFCNKQWYSFDTRNGRMQHINVSMAYKVYKRIQVNNQMRNQRTSNRTSTSRYGKVTTPDLLPTNTTSQKYMRKLFSSNRQETKDSDDWNKGNTSCVPSWTRLSWSQHREGEPKWNTVATVLKVTVWELKQLETQHKVLKRKMLWESEEGLNK